MVATLQQQQQQQQQEEEGGGDGGISINNNVDLLAEILGRLDARSLAVAARVCRLWAAVTRRRMPSPSPSPATRSVVTALGGYRRLYRRCLGPALDRLDGRRTALNRWAGEPWPIHLDRAEAQAQLSVSLSLFLSLFSIDCYERLGPARQRPASLLFLCRPVDLARSGP
ncbi:F-box protein SNE-like [Ananas comosus]|uniref:F-box protein SNE-like n=1 Tax=Ananas comosus TaxID=4615 RepID=A0A6P5GBA8_ANACO|nr:F-box protein SNE-like [Ananas comosus]